MSKPDNPSAFPHPSGAQGCEGMTLRDWFAGQALQICTKNMSDPVSAWAAEAYKLADAMLAERERHP